MPQSIAHDAPTHRTLNGTTLAWTPTTQGAPTTWTPGPGTQEGTTPLAPTCPEALCSITLPVDVPGYANRALVTGRGSSGVEAAHNLKANVEALAAAFAPVKPTVASLLACGLEKATKRQDWPLVERLAKGAALVLSGAVEPGNREGLWAVRSQSNPLNFYEVDSVSCNCPDATHRAKEGEHYFCKHLLAAMFLVKMQAEPAIL